MTAPVDTARPQAPLPLLRGQKALVTGANSGIGRATAIELGRAGADVVVNYVSDREAADDVVKEIESFGVRAYAHEADVSQEDQVVGMFRRMVQEFGTIDVLVANAGLQRDASTTDMTVDQWRKVLDVNLTGQFLCAREAAREFCRRGPVPEVSRAVGKIICMSSVHQVIPWSGHVNYAASKGGVEMMMRTMAQEFAPQGIRVNAVAPGVTETAASRTYVDEDPDRDRTAIAMGRRGRPEEQAGPILFLLSDLSSYITGQTLLVDGGLNLRWSHLGADNTSLFLRDESFRAAIKEM